MTRWESIPSAHPHYRRCALQRLLRELLPPNHALNRQPQAVADQRDPKAAPAAHEQAVSARTPGQAEPSEEEAGLEEPGEEVGEESCGHFQSRACRNGDGPDKTCLTQTTRCAAQGNPSLPLQRLPDRIGETQAASLNLRIDLGRTP